jgi:hypothetical protein
MAEEKGKVHTASLSGGGARLGRTDSTAKVVSELAELNVSLLQAMETIARGGQVMLDLGGVRARLTNLRRRAIVLADQEESI